MCFAPQRRALFRHVDVQKWPERIVILTFWLEMCFAPQQRAIFHFSSGRQAPHPPLVRTYFSTRRSHTSVKQHNVSRLSYLFAHLHLPSSQAAPEPSHLEVASFFAQRMKGWHLTHGAKPAFPVPMSLPSFLDLLRVLVDTGWCFHIWLLVSHDRFLQGSAKAKATSKMGITSWQYMNNINLEAEGHRHSSFNGKIWTNIPGEFAWSNTVASHLH